MSERETAEAIEADAIAWVARLDRAGDEACLEAELAAWLGDDARRRGAYFRAQAAWRMLDRASVLRGSAQQASAEPASGDSYAEERDDGEFVEAVPFISRRRLLFGGLAAAGVAGLFVLGRSDWDMPVQRIETAIGEIRRVPLEDGSMAAVNTASRLAVRLQPDTRQVELAQGEAWFQVAHDAARPFVVEAGDVRVQAVGTAFSVRRTAAGADIQVTDGTVEVWSVAQPEPGSQSLPMRDRRPASRPMPRSTGTSPGAPGS
jgi:transmembrane sensor